MSEYKDRLRELRKSTGLSQADFAQRLGLSRGVIKNLEEGRTDARSALTDLICTTYNADVIWLETGEGKMFRKMTRREKIADFVSRTLADETDDFKTQLILVLAALSEDGWKKLKAAAEELKKAEQKAEQDNK